MKINERRGKERETRKDRKKRKEREKGGQKTNDRKNRKEWEKGEERKQVWSTDDASSCKFSIFRVATDDEI